MTATASGEGTGAVKTGGTGAEGRGTGVELGAEVAGLETGVGGLLQGLLLNPHFPVWPRLGLSGQAAAG